VEPATETTTTLEAEVVTSNTPLRGNLYEVEALAAEVLIEDEDDLNTPVKIRRLSAQVLCVLFVVIVIVAVAMVVVRRNNTNDTNNDNTIADDLDNVPAVEGWTPVGDFLTVEDPVKDYIRFGNSVATSASGNRIAVGLPGSDDPEDEGLRGTGGVEVFDLVNDTNGTAWERTFRVFGAYSNAEAGTSVALSDDGRRIAIGAPSKNSAEGGYVSIYQESGTTGIWELAGNISASSAGDTNGVFGDAMGFSGDGKTIAIGDKDSDALGLEDTGVVSVYRETNGTWNQLGDSLSGTEERGRFGWSVALSKDGKRVAASSPGSRIDQPGRVSVFGFNGASWEEVGSGLVGESTWESFGVSVELSGDGSVVAVGATGYSSGNRPNVGIVRSYRCDNDEEGEGEEQRGWSPYGQPLVGENESDDFGSSIALSRDGDTIAIGGPQNDSFCSGCGYAWVFRFRTTTTTTTTEEGEVSSSSSSSWESVGSSLGTSGIDRGEFGSALALSANGNRLVVTAPSSIFNGFLSEVGQVFVFDKIEVDSIPPPPNNE